jgi:hypothetical protein
MGSDSFPTLNSSKRVFVPLKSAAAAASARKKVSAHLASRGEKDDGYGESDSRGMTYFWYYDSGGRKNHLAIDKTGLYQGNSPDLIDMVRDGKSLSRGLRGTATSSMPGRETFFYGYIGSGSLVKTLLSLHSGAGGFNIFRTSGRIVFHGKKIDNGLHLAVEMESEAADR